MKQHITKVEKLYPHEIRPWAWVCSCGQSDTGFLMRSKAVNASHLHRTMEMLKEIK